MHIKSTSNVIPDVWKERLQSKTYNAFMDDLFPINKKYEEIYIYDRLAGFVLCCVVPINHYWRIINNKNYCEV